MNRNLSLLAMILIFALAACRSAPSAAPTCTSLKISAPASLPAGAPASINLNATAADGAQVQIIATGSYGGRIYTAKIVNGKASLVFPSQATQTSGLVHIKALCGAATASAEMTLTPGAPANPLTPLIGPHAVIADGDHWSMVVVIPNDAFGNPVADNTPVVLRSLHADGQLEEEIIHTQRLMTWKRVYSGTKAGKTTIAAQSGNAYGSEATLLEMAGFPAPFDVAADPPTLPADGRQQLNLRTTLLKDKFENILPDGTLVTFIVEASDGSRQYIPAYTVDGICEAPLQASAAPQTYTVRGTLYGVESAPLLIHFADGPAVGNFPLSAHINLSKQAVILTGGPILGALKQYAPDGTKVNFRITAPDSVLTYAVGIVDRGFVTVELRLAVLIAGTYKVEATAGSGSGQARIEIP